MSEQQPYDVDALKKKHGDTLFVTPIRLPDAIGGAEIKLVWKPPTHTTYQRFMQALDKQGAEVANRQLFIAVVVHPERDELLALAESAPLAVALFLNQGGVTDFFGGETAVQETMAL